MGRKVQVTNLETGEVLEFKSMYIARKFLEVNTGRISLLNGKTGRIKGVLYEVIVS